MPISRVMNNPDGSTPVPPIGGGDQNGTLARSILGAQAGTSGHPLAVPRHLHLQTSVTGTPQVAVKAQGEGESAPIALEEAGEIDPILSAEQDHGATEPARRAASVSHAARHGRARPKRQRRLPEAYQRWRDQFR